MVKSTGQDGSGHIRILALSDTIVPFIYGSQVKRRFSQSDFIIGCGDLPYFYLEYVLNALDKPLFFVRGNHDKIVEYSGEGQRVAPGGGTNLHGKILNYRGLILAGIEGSLRYRPGPFMYTQQEMWQHVLRLIPKLLYNRIVHGRYLDIFVTHAPPAGIHDMDDFPHQGIHAFRWFIRLFQPLFHLHGHIHIYQPDTATVSQVGKTCVMNVYSFREIEIAKV